MLPARRIAIAGAGSIGCYVGGCLALAGREVRFLLRPRLCDELTRHGLHLTDLDGTDRRLPPEALALSTDAATALGGADLVLVTVKSGDTAAMAALLAAHCPAGTTILSLQNGVGNADILAGALPGRRVLAGTVPFNVVQAGQGRFHRASGGPVLVEATGDRLTDILAVPGLPLAAAADMPAVQWGKLLLNLNNALNALCGLPLRAELADRRWRRLLAAQQREALTALAAAGIRPARVGAVRPSLLPRLLDLPDPLFRLLAGRMLRIDPEARSSMWEDLHFRRPTEVDWLQGAVVDLAGRAGLEAPVNRRVHAAMKAAEAAGQGSPGLTPDALLPG